MSTENTPEDDPQRSAVFNMAFTMAGAVSGGAYTAGVLDFFIEALDTWYAAKASKEDVPRHDVLVKGASGASAGAMCSTILGAILDKPITHVSAASVPAAGQAIDNPLYESWVRDIDIKEMLETEDLSSSTPVPSLLNSRPIDTITHKVLNYCSALPPPTRPWAAQPFFTRLTLTNLRGVSYDVGFRGAQGAGHQMRVHADHMDFRLSTGHTAWGPVSLPELATAPNLPPDRAAAPGDWENLGLAAMASAAFPFALKPRALSRPHTDYDQRLWVDVTGDQTAQAFLPPQLPAGTYRFYSMDGGVMNNEPFELARQILTQSPWDPNPRTGDKAFNAVVMIDPFVEDSAMPADIAGRSTTRLPVFLHQLIGPLLGAMKMQCRFKPEELALAHRADLYSRFLIAPSRSGGTPLPHPLASAGLGAFMGLFHESFRQHDYLLGRRNAQQFLKQHFTLPATNPIIQTGYFSDGAPSPALAHFAATQADGSTEWPIIPLCSASLRTQEPLPAWPVGQLKVEPLRDPIKGRIMALVKYLRAELGGSSSAAFKVLVWIASALVTSIFLNRIAASAVDTIKDERDKAGL